MSAANHLIRVSEELLALLQRGDARIEECECSIQWARGHIRKVERARHELAERDKGVTYIIQKRRAIPIAKMPAHILTGATP